MPKSPLTHGLRDRIALELRQDIVSGRLAPGDQLVERQLASRFGVSHAPIREALLQLTHEGLLVSRINRGAQVAPPVATSIRQLFAPMRQSLEIYAVRRVFGEVDEAELAQWGQVVDRLEEACGAHDGPAVAEIDFEFHQAIVERGGEIDVISAWRSAMARARMKIDAPAADYTALCQFNGLHRRMLARWAAKDLDGTLAALAANIEAETAIEREQMARGA